MKKYLLLFLFPFFPVLAHASPAIHFYYCRDYLIEEQKINQAYAIVINDYHQKLFQSKLFQKLPPVHNSRFDPWHAEPHVWLQHVEACESTRYQTHLEKSSNEKILETLILIEEGKQ